MSHDATKAWYNERPLQNAPQLPATLRRALFGISHARRKAWRSCHVEEASTASMYSDARSSRYWRRRELLAYSDASKLVRWRRRPPRYFPRARRRTQEMRPARRRATWHMRLQQTDGVVERPSIVELLKKSGGAQTKGRGRARGRRGPTRGSRSATRPWTRRRAPCSSASGPGR